MDAIYAELFAKGRLCICKICGQQSLTHRRPLVNQFDQRFNNDGHQFNPKYILGYNPTSVEQSDKLAKFPAAGVQRKPPNENTDQPIGLVDWNRILARLKQKTDARNVALNETSTLNLVIHQLRPFLVVHLDRRKQFVRLSDHNGARSASFANHLDNKFVRS